MSINIKTKEIEYIDDCRGLNCAECMGLIFYTLSFNNELCYSTKIIEISDISFINNFFNCLTNYAFYCNPDTKATIIKFNTNNDNIYYFYFVPKEENGIEIQVKNSNLEIIATAEYSVEQIQNFMV